MNCPTSIRTPIVAGTSRSAAPTRTSAPATSVKRTPEHHRPRAQVEAVDDAAPRQRHRTTRSTLRVTDDPASPSTADDGVERNSATSAQATPKKRIASTGVWPEAGVAIHAHATIAARRLGGAGALSPLEGSRSSGSLGATSRGTATTSASTEAPSKSVPTQRRSSAIASTGIRPAPIRACAGHGIERIGDVHDARRQRNVIADAGHRDSRGHRAARDAARRSGCAARETECCAGCAPRPTGAS